MTKTGQRAPGVRIIFGAPEAQIAAGDATAELRIPAPVLAGPGAEPILDAADGDVSVDDDGGVTLALVSAENDSLVAGAAVAPISGSLADDAFRLYERLIRAVGNGRHVYRIWNYVPDINAMTDGLEHYRAFNLGRGRALQEAGFQPAAGTLPAASAVGISGDRLAAAFIAGRPPAQHFENPDQIPAYRYPERYGPHPPSFCRASRIGASGPVFLSGTASIRGHETISPDNAADQIGVTLENVARMLETLGIRRLDALKCYLRRAEDLDVVRTAIDKFPAAPDDRSAIPFLKADICRSDLAVEIEGSAS